MKNSFNQYIHSETDKLTLLLQKEILGTFKAAIKIIESNNLRYWACGGTALGAVRHHGFIPWDDDIDIYMPRSDYNFLINEISKSLYGKYKIVSMNDEGYYLPFAKIINTETTIWESEYYPFLIGVFVDIFPLDFFNDYSNIQSFQTELTKREWDYYRFLGDCSNRILKDLIKRKHYRVFCYKLLRRIFGDSILKTAYNRYIDFDNKQQRLDNGTYCLCVYCNDPVFEGKWFENSIEMPFEDIMIRMPSCYNEYLTCCFGDYMKLPPVSERVSCHSHYYLNLKEGLSMEEVRCRLSCGEYLVY